MIRCEASGRPVEPLLAEPGGVIAAPPRLALLEAACFIRTSTCRSSCARAACNKARSALPMVSWPAVPSWEPEMRRLRACVRDRESNAREG